MSGIQLPQLSRSSPYGTKPVSQTNWSSPRQTNWSSPNQTSWSSASSVDDWNSTNQSLASSPAVLQPSSAITITPLYDSAETNVDQSGQNVQWVGSNSYESASPLQRVDQGSFAGWVPQSEINTAYEEVLSPAQTYYSTSPTQSTMGYSRVATIPGSPQIVYPTQRGPVFGNPIQGSFVNNYVTYPQQSFAQPSIQSFARSPVQSFAQPSIEQPFAQQSFEDMF